MSVAVDQGEVPASVLHRFREETPMGHSPGHGSILSGNFCVLEVSCRETLGNFYVLDVSPRATDVTVWQQNQIQSCQDVTGWKQKTATKLPGCDRLETKNSYKVDRI